MTGSVLACATAPGKLILAGEHSVVHGRPALVAAVDRRVTAKVWAGEGTGQDPTTEQVEIVLPDLDFEAAARWSRVMAFGEAARAAWSEYDRNPGRDSFRLLLDDDPARLVKLALVEATLRRPAVAQRVSRVEVASDLPIGSGLGSSAAVGAAVLAAVLAAVDRPFDVLELEPMALQVERHQHGSPSGLDTAAVLRGGVLRVRRVDGAMEVSPVDSTLSALKGLRVFDSGAPSDTTGEVVSSVRSLLRSKPAETEACLDELGLVTDDFCDRLENDRYGDLADPVRRLHRGLCRLGVVPAEVQERVAEIERLGGAAKISGAGSLAGPGAGMLLVYHPEAAFSDLETALAGYRPVEGKLGGRGLEVISKAGNEA